MRVLLLTNEPSRIATVLDGFHPLFKADLTGQQMIMVKKVPQGLFDSVGLQMTAPGAGPGGFQDGSGR